MIGPLLWLIYLGLLTYLDTERALHSFGVNIGFSDEHQVLMKNLYVFTMLHGIQTRSSNENSVCPIDTGILSFPVPVKMAVYLS